MDHRVPRGGPDLQADRTTDEVNDLRNFLERARRHPNVAFHLASMTGHAGPRVQVPQAGPGWINIDEDVA